TQSGGAAEYALAPEQNCVRLPEGLSAFQAALTEPVACSVNAFDSLPRRLGDHYLVYGAGTMGLIMARLAMTNGAAGVSVIELQPGRRQVAESLGLHAVASADEAPREGGRGHEVVIDCTGVAAAINDGLPRVAPGGTFVHIGVPPEGTLMEYDAHRVYRYEISIVGSMSVQHSMERAADLLAAGLIDVDAVITDRFDLDGCGDALQAIRDGRGIKSVVLPHGELMC
ncbi:MAG: zinc-binding dehydrogenase, partial [Ornithinimicrobium sp.]